MKTAVVGATGLLGSDLCKLLTKKFSVRGYSRAEMDLLKDDQIVQTLNSFEPNVVINATGYTQVDKAETDRDACYALNVTAVEHLVKWCRTADAHFIHFSTDQVFGNDKNTARTETDPVDPLNYYALTKYQGEQLALDYPHAMVMRVQWLYGEKRNRFLVLKDRKELPVFSDQFGAPTWTMEIARAIGTMVEKKSTGLFHFAYDDHNSWQEIFEWISTEWDLPIELRPTLTAEANLPARRPHFSVLNGRKLAKELGRDKMGSWKEPFRIFWEQYVENRGK